MDKIKRIKMNKDRKITDFNIGDFCSFTKTYTEEDFDKFKELSLDENPLHHDSVYAEGTPFKSTIVPLHLAASPLSAVAGMAFPGHRSLYLSHDIKALKPVPYNKEITYSAKLVGISDFEGVLSLKTIAFNGSEVYFTANQRIKVRNEEINPEKVDNLKAPFDLQNPQGAVLVTGAAGEIGRSICFKLAKQGNNLILVARKQSEKLDDLINKLKALNVQIEVLTLDLVDTSVSLIREQLLTLKQSVKALIHAACPPIDSTVSDLMNVNFQALSHFLEALTPHWLTQQEGCAIFISSSAVHYNPPEMEAYTAAKSATVNYLSGFHNKFQQWGIRSHAIAVGKVDTVFSKDLKVESNKQLLPEQVAEEVVKTFENSQSFYSWLESSGTRYGDYQFVAAKSKNKQIVQQSSLTASNSSVSSSLNLEDSLASFMDNFFKVDEEIDWSIKGVNLVSGWGFIKTPGTTCTVGKRVQHQIQLRRGGRNR